MENPEVRKQFEKALDLFIDKAKEDKKVLALILYGSLAYDEVYDSSNINIYVITTEGQHKWTRLIENGIPIDIAIYNQNDFKRRIQGGAESVAYHQVLSFSKLLFSRDETFTQFYNNIDRKLRMKDKATQQIIYHGATRYDIEKAEKYLYIKNDLIHSFYYLMHGVSELGYLVCYMNDTFPPREVLQKLKEFEPTLYQEVYLDVLQNKVTKESLEKAITKVYDFLNKTDLQTFKPILDFISENNGIVTQTELDTFFRQKSIPPVELEYLHRRRIIRRTISPTRLTKKGLIDYNEPQYHFNRDSFDPKNITPTHIGPYEVERARVLKDYQKALDDLVEKAKADNYILSFMLCGSLSYDTVWEKSDIDILMITNDVVYQRYRCLLENDVYFDAYISTRDEFRKWIQRITDGSQGHSWFSKSKLIFTRDESIHDLYEDINNIGSADLEDYVLLNYAFSRDLIKKAERALYVKEDPLYSFYFIMATVRRLAIIEVLLNKTIPLREVVQQALEINPEFFDVVYKELAVKPNKNKETIKQTIKEITKYLEDRLEIIAQPLIKYLVKEQEASHYDLKTKFRSIRLPLDLTDFVKKGIISQTEAPIRFTQYSSVELTQPAYTAIRKDDEIMMDFIN